MAIRTDILYTLIHRLGLFRVGLFFLVEPLFNELFGWLQALYPVWARLTPEAIREGYQPKQPVPYSHALHVGARRFALDRQ